MATGEGYLIHWKMTFATFIRAPFGAGMLSWAGCTITRGFTLDITVVV